MESSGELNRESNTEEYNEVEQFFDRRYTMKEAKKVVEPEMEVKPCVQCGKQIANFYGRWGNAGTCSKKCEELQEKEVHESYTKFLGARAVHVAKLRGDFATSKT